MVNIFTFCVDIKHHPQINLINSLKLLVGSLEKNVPSYKLIVYTNFDIPQLTPNIEIRQYYNNSVNVKYKSYSDHWLNLSFNKINLYKDLKEETQKDFLWVDLDTVICGDITYINDLEHLLLITGGSNLDPHGLFPNNPNYNIYRKDYIQGNIWKLNDHFFELFYKTYNNLIENGLIPKYDLQDVFNYIIHFDKSLHNPIILGDTFKKNSINSLAVWAKEGNTHANLNGLKNLYLDGNKVKSLFYPDKEIDFLSFTFTTLNHLYHTEEFKNFITKITINL